MLKVLYRNFSIKPAVCSCMEDNELLLKDETAKIFINAAGEQDNISEEMSCFLDFLKTGKGSSDLTRQLEEAVEKAKNHEEWEVEYMTWYAKIQEEREEAAINQLIESNREFNVPDSDIVMKLIKKFHLSEDEAMDCIKEYDLQPV